MGYDFKHYRPEKPFKFWSERPIFGKKEMSKQKANLRDIRRKREYEIKSKKLKK